MLELLSLWSHLLAAALYGALAIFQLRHWNGDPRNRPLVTAFAVMAVWTIFLAMLDSYDFLTQLAESARNLAFLAFMYGIMREGDESGSQHSVKAVYAAVAAAVGLQIVVGGIISEFRGQPILFERLVWTAQLIGITISSGSLILVHNLYGQAAPGSRGALRFPMIALAVMWAYDLHLYTVAYFTGGLAPDLFAMRGAVLALLVPLFALGLRGAASWKFQLSRAATFQSVSLIAILAYLVLMMTGAQALDAIGGDWARAAEFGILAAMTMVAILVLPSAKARAWFRIFIAKHAFEHRYDYRAEWLRFTDTIGREGHDSPSLEERVAKAMADIAGSPGGLLLLADAHYRLTPAGCWRSDIVVPTNGDGAEPLLRHMESSNFILAFDNVRDGWMSDQSSALAVPHWLARLDSAWAGVPLIHAGKLVGLVILEHPPIRRQLDWEDFDLFRTAGIQAASYIAEARGQQALADSRRFDEFNRRFAFIMHDIKNLVSQLSLVARNAERHADNPEFRADMIATLQSSVKKMNDLLVRLSPGAVRTAAEPARLVRIIEPVEAVVAAKRHAHPVRVGGDPALAAKADRIGLEQALGHLVQNAIDASPTDAPVEIAFFESGGDVVIEVADRGIGMSEEFVRTRLFQPFASTKESGFGLGAYEARALIVAMGGRIEVETLVGEGTRFTLFLPGAVVEAAPEHERMRA
jgi:putative PEP-CTERM system histidine kinase